MEKHVAENKMTQDTQTGFTKGGRPEFNLFVLQHIAHKAFEPKCEEEKLIYITLDFKKAYDSIDRTALIETLVHYKINSNLI